MNNPLSKIHTSESSVHFPPNVLTGTFQDTGYNQIKSNQIKSNQIKSYQIKLKYLKSEF